MHGSEGDGDPYTLPLPLPPLTKNLNLQQAEGSGKRVSNKAPIIVRDDRLRSCLGSHLLNVQTVGFRITSMRIFTDITTNVRRTNNGTGRDGVSGGGWICIEGRCNALCDLSVVKKASFTKLT